MSVTFYLDMPFFHNFVCRSSAVIVFTCLKMFETHVLKLPVKKFDHSKVAGLPILP